MSDKKIDEEKKSKGCGSCGDERVMMTEEMYAIPRCAGCGKSLGQSSKED